MPWYENDGQIRLWYEERGSGPALVLLHGWCMSSTVWQNQLTGLARSFRVIAPDLRGHGKSEKSANGYDFEGFSADIGALFRHLDLRGALLAGWSLGAQVALLAGSQVRERLSGLVLISGTPRFTVADDFPHALKRVVADGMAVKVRRNLAKALNGFTKLMFAPGELDDSALAGRVGDLLATIPLPETDTALRALQALVINGDRDRICLPEASDYMAQKIGSSCHVVLSGCGHAPFLTRNDEFDESIANFSRRIFEQGR